MTTVWRLFRRLVRSKTVIDEGAKREQTSSSSQSGRSAEALFYDVAMMRLNRQAAEIASIDGKASTMFTIGSTILPITASLLSTDRDTFTDCRVAMYSLVVGSAFYVALAVLFVLAYRLAKWDYRPELEQWRDVTLGRQEEEIQRWLGNACVEAYRANVPQLETKARLVGFSLACLAFEAVFLTVAVLAPLPLF